MGGWREWTEDRRKDKEVLLERGVATGRREVRMGKLREWTKERRIDKKVMVERGMAKSGREVKNGCVERMAWGEKEEQSGVS